jgi:hypothetical protein
MLKFAIAAGLFALTVSAAPASAQDAAANQCRAAAGHVKVFDGATGTLRQQPTRTAAYDALMKLDGVPGESKDSVRTAREHGSRAAVGRRRSAGGVHVASGDVDGDGATEAAAARMQCQNNLKQMGTAAR